MSCHSKDNLGFTLVELLVSIAIVSVILGIVISNQSTYTDGIALTNLADEIGLRMAQAQAYGVAVKEFSPGSSEFSASYGLTFSLLDSGSDKAYLSFADRNGNQIYDGDWLCPIGGASECLGRTNITRGNQIDSLCVVTTFGADLCNVGGRIDVSFTRPSTATRLLFFDPQGQQYSPTDVAGAKIVLRSPKGTTRAVAIYNTGQVSIGPALFPIPPPSFDYSLSHSGNMRVNQGSAGSNLITLTLVAGVTESVALSASGLPPEVSASFLPNICNPTCSSILTITTDTSTPKGTYLITVAGSPLSKTTIFKLVVK